MDLTDARTRKKVTLNPRTVVSNSWVFIQHVRNMTVEYLLKSISPAHCRVSGRVATDIVFLNAVLVASLWTVKEWLLSQNVGVFWVLMRILGCGALGLGFKEVATGDAPKAFAAASSAKVRASFILFCLFSFH